MNLALWAAKTGLDRANTGCVISKFGQHQYDGFQIGARRLSGTSCPEHRQSRTEHAEHAICTA